MSDHISRVNESFTCARGIWNLSLEGGIMWPKPGFDARLLTSRQAKMNDVSIKTRTRAARIITTERTVLSEKHASAVTSTPFWADDWSEAASMNVKNRSNGPRGNRKCTTIQCLHKCFTPYSTHPRYTSPHHRENTKRKEMKQGQILYGGHSLLFLCFWWVFSGEPAKQCGRHTWEV